MYLMGVQCSAGSVQPVFGRSLFQQNNGVFQSNSSSSNEIAGLSSLSSSATAANLVSTSAFHHLNGSTLGAPSPVHLHQLNVTNQSNGLSSLTNGLNGNSREHHRENNGKLHNSSLMRNGSLNNNNNANNSISPVLLDYFPNANNDGLFISWIHGVNNRARLNHALSSKFYERKMFYSF